MLKSFRRRGCCHRRISTNDKTAYDNCHWLSSRTGSSSALHVIAQLESKLWHSQARSVFVRARSAPRRCCKEGYRRYPTGANLDSKHRRRRQRKTCQCANDAWGCELKGSQSDLCCHRARGSHTHHNSPKPTDLTAPSCMTGIME